MNYVDVEYEYAEDRQKLESIGDHDLRVWTLQLLDKIRKLQHAAVDQGEQNGSHGSVRETSI